MPSMRVSHSKLTLATALAALALFSCTRTGTDKNGPAPDTQPQAKTCETSGTPEVRALYTAEGVLLWEEGMNFPRKNIFYDAIEVHGVNLCAGQFTIADGYTRARPLPFPTHAPVRVHARAGCHVPAGATPVPPPLAPTPPWLLPTISWGLPWRG